MNKIDLATNIVLVNYCLSKEDCDSCACGYSKGSCDVYEYVSRDSDFYKNNRIIAMATRFCKSQVECRNCIYKQDSYLSHPFVGNDCSTNILSVRYVEMRGKSIIK